MTYISLPQDQQRVIGAMDRQAFESAIDRCVTDEKGSPLYGLGLRESWKHMGQCLGRSSVL